jgi:hypothetical protein
MIVKSRILRKAKTSSPAECIDVQQSNAMVFNRFCRKTGLPLVGLVALLSEAQ